MSSINRHFLGWEKPFLAEAANWLQDHHLQHQLGGNNSLLVLVSGKEVARRLKRILVGNAAAKGSAVVLPPIETTLQCLDRLLGTTKQTADETTTLIVTASVLRSMPWAELTSIAGMRRPDDQDNAAWFALAKQVCTAWSTLTGGGLSPQRTTWPEQAQLKLTESAEKRFDALQQIQQQVQSVLLEENLQLLETARMELLSDSHQIDLQNIEHVVLIGTADLSGIVTKTIDRLSDSGVLVDSLVRAPESASNTFDAYGCVDVNHWSQAMIDIPDDYIQVAGSPSSQGAAVIRELSLAQDSFTTDQITIASTDEALIPILQCHLSGHAIQNRFAGGKPVLQSPVAVLLKAASDLIRTKAYSAFSAFVRHPDIAKLLDVQETTLAALDQYSMELVPAHVDPAKWIVPQRKIRGIGELVTLHKRTFDLLSPLTTLQSKKAEMASCSAAIRSFLIKVYGGETLERSDPKLVSLQTLFDVIDQFDALHRNFSSQLGLLDASTLIGLLLNQIETLTIPEYPNPEAIETVGWLEAMAVDSPCLIVVGMSADLVGGNNPGDAFFPDTLRGALGLETINRRLARDAHAMAAMQRMRREDGKLVWIVARKNTNGDPLSPSPLLLRCEDAKVLAKRAKRLVVSLDQEEPEVPNQFMPVTIGTGIQIPRPDSFDIEAISKISVTAFKDYIACPYRFWLKYVMGLRVVEEGGTELDPKLFGSLVHKAVEKFGLDTSIRDSSDECEIFRSLSSYLDAVVLNLFGENIAQAIRIQVELARFRLGEVAKHQANSVKEGWHIHCSERKLSKKIDVDGKSMTISGVIDRVDLHKDGRVRVLDYKTGGATANDAHFKKRDGEWIDLQLPLYSLLLCKIEELEGEDTSAENVSLGYFRIGDQEATTGIDLLELPDEAMATVDDVITSIMSDIQTGKFGKEPTVPAPKYSEEFAWICQDDSITEEAGGED